jgi:hypothetical protein
MTLSSKQIGEIAYLYESIAAYEQEQLNEAELTGAQRNTKINTELKASNAEVIRRGGIAGSIGRGLTSMFGSQKDIDNNKASDKASDARVRQAGAASVGKYYSSSDGKTYANYNDAKAAKNSRDAKAATPKPTEQPQRQPATPSRPAAAPANAKVLPSKPAGSAMDQWAKANPKLAAAKAERDRTRGTSATTNPLMKDMKSSLPAPAPKAASTSTLSQATAAASKPSSFSPAPATTSQATAAAPSTSPAASGSVAPITKTIASAPKPTPVAPKVAPAAGGYTSREGDGKPRKKEDILFSYQYEDAYDLVLEYLLDNGHVDTVEEAHYVMMELDAEVIQDIVEEVLAEDANYDRNRRRAAQRAAARNAARDAGKTGAVPGVGYVTPRREGETYRDSTGTERHKSGAKMPEKKG